MNVHPDLEWTEYKRGFRALTKDGNCWVEWSELHQCFEIIYENTPHPEFYLTIAEAMAAAQVIHNEVKVDLCNSGSTRNGLVTGQSPNVVSLQEVIQSLSDLLQGDNLPDRIAIHTADLKQILPHLNQDAFAVTFNDDAVKTFINAMPFEEIRHSRRASIKSALTLTADMHFSKEKI